MKNIAKILFINILVLICLIAVVEIVLRVNFPVATYVMDIHSELASVTGWGPTIKKDGYELACDNPHSSNSKAGVTRVLTLGDSLLDCNESGSQPFEITIPSLLGKSLGDFWEVYNLSAGGWGTDQEFLAYRTLGARYKPDWVILFYTPANDLYNNSSSKAIFENIAKPVFLIENGELKLKPIPPHLAVSNSPFQKMVLRMEIGKRLFLMAHQYGFVANNDATVKDIVAPASKFETEPYAHMAPSFKPLLPRFERSWEVTKRLLVEFNKEVKNNGSKFAIVYVPTGIRNLCDPLKEYPANCIGYDSKQEIPVSCNGESMIVAPYHQYNLIKEFGLKEGFPVVQDFKQFRPYATNHNALAGDCIHFNHKQGAQFVVDQVSGLLRHDLKTLPDAR